jgi:proline iminopeptidase
LKKTTPQRAHSAAAGPVNPQRGQARALFLCATAAMLPILVNMGSCRPTGHAARRDGGWTAEGRLGIIRLMNRRRLNGPDPDPLSGGIPGGTMNPRTASMILLAAAALAACSSSTTETETMQQEPGLQNGSFNANLNGFDIHYEVHGDGPVMMVVPNSWGFDVTGLRGVYRPLEEHLTMVYFDPRGMGGSGPIREEADMGIAAVRADFDALRGHLGLEKVNAIGWSNGAMNLLLLAAERPETIDTAIFLHGAASYGPEDMSHMAENYPELMRAFAAMQEELKNPELTDEQKTARMHQAWIESYFPVACADAEAMMPVLSQTFLVDSFSWPHADYSQREAPGFDARDRLGEITARSLIIVGEHDTMPPEKGEVMRDGIAGSELVVLESSGHFSTLEEPEKLVQVVMDFLESE